jgi:chemosensory pili system protein ChpA (sensor histidine kinase/response regulator)
MSGVEPIIAAEAAAATAATAATNAAAITATEIAAAEAAAAAAAEAAAATAATTAAEVAATEAATAAAAETAATAGTQTAAQSLLSQELFGPEMYARMVPGLTESGIGSQAAMLAQQTGQFGLPGLTATGAAAATPGTLSSAAWNLANKAMLPGPANAKDILQGARLISQPQQGGTRTNVSPPMLNRGKEVSLAAPVYGLLGGAPMPKRRRLSLI